METWEVILGFVIFIWGIYEFRSNNKIKKAEFLDTLIKDFLNPQIDIARNLLDDYVYVEKINRNKSPIEQKELGKELSLLLRDHTKVPIGSKDEIIVRKSFDFLLDFLTKLSYYLKQKLISPKELTYFKYYLLKIESKKEVISYIENYYYIQDFYPLFKAINKEKNSKMKKITICSKFDLFPDDTILGSSFSYSNFNFFSKNGVSIMVNETNGERGITIRPKGISVDFIDMVNYVSFRVGIFDGNPIDVIAKDVNGNVVTKTKITGHNQYIDSILFGQNIKSVDFDTNGLEEILVSICINLL